MKLHEVLADMKLAGVSASERELSLLRAEFGPLAKDWLLKLVSSFRLAGTELDLSEGDDISGLGGSIQWMTVRQIIEEATEAYPGIVAVKKGMIPFGMCLLGSGDPYFLRVVDDAETTAVVRIYHDAVGENSMNESAVAPVAVNLAAFFEKAKMRP